MGNIPKVIHFCWFGKNEKSELINKCINSWKVHLPEYKIVEWNEENFDLNSNLFVKEAYKEKKWAFVSDYVRLYALYHHGGIYLDTDVELIRDIAVFLNKGCFSGFEDVGSIPTGIMGAVSHHPVIESFLNYYSNRSFYLQNGEIDVTTNVEIITKMSFDEGFVPNGEYQMLNNGFHIYPKEYFCPKDYVSGKITITENTYCIHHFNGSWTSNKHKKKRALRQYFFSVFGEKFMWKILSLKKKLTFKTKS